MDAWDEKERVYHGSVGGNAVELRISGYDVTADGVGPCGTNSMLVYYAFFWEDDDRETPSSSEIEAEGT